MANRPVKAYGLTADVRNKISMKYSIKDEQRALKWIEECLGKPDLFEGVEGEEATSEALKDGITLCELYNTISLDREIHGISRNIKPGVKGSFQMRSNIEKFLLECQNYGVPTFSLFQVVDLYEMQNMVNVMNCIYALSSAAQKNGHQGPILGPKESAKNVRAFSHEKLAEGRSIIGLQYGSNKGASQSGLNFGKTRSIMD